MPWHVACDVMQHIRFYLVNLEKLTQRWEIDVSVAAECEGGPNNETARNIVRVYPDKGDLPGLQEQDVRVSVTTTEVGSGRVRIGFV